MKVEFIFIGLFPVIIGLLGVANFFVVKKIFYTAVKKGLKNGIYLDSDFMKFYTSRGQLFKQKIVEIKKASLCDGKKLEKWLLFSKSIGILFALLFFMFVIVLLLKDIQQAS